MLKIFTFFLTVFVLGSCTTSSDFAQLKYEVERDRNEALQEGIKSSRKIFWLMYQDDIKKMRPEYPEDIKLINNYIQSELTQGLDIKAVEKFKKTLKKCGKWCEIFISGNAELLPIPLHENKEHGRVYLYFRPEIGVSDLIHVNKDNVVKRIFFMDRKIVYYNKYLEKWRPNTEWQFNENYILSNLD